ncbi:MAG: ABC transporter permease [Mogibacterium sp.]|nr:ABC transporter permease [Mogibacterium sp.]
MKKFFSNIKKYNKYAIRSAKAELHSEVADSRLNWLWWVIEPFCYMLIYTFVFGVVFQNKTPYFASFVFLGITTWDYFNRTVSGSVRTIVSNRDLVTKVYIPKYILLISKTYTYLFKMGIALCIAFALMLFQRVPITWRVIFLIPIIFVLYVVTFGIGTILMHAGVGLNDLENLVRIGLRMVFYLSGVFYNIKTRLSGTLQFIVLRANPSAFLMSEMRKVCLEESLPSFEGLFIWLVIGLILCAVGIHLIHKNENSYAKAV